MLNEGRMLQNKEGKFSNLTALLPPPPMLEMSMDKAVGLDFQNEKVLNWLLHHEQVRVIGLYGPGGVGKTTLLKRIKEELSNANHGFEVIIWVVVSKQLDQDRIQDTIRKRLDIKDELWKRWTRAERVHHLWEDLTHKKFVLLIDDLWEWLDLSQIGVPCQSPQNGSNVVFTTRMKQVCYQMEADGTLEVQSLMPHEALELFVNNVGKSTIHSHPDISNLAKDTVIECRGWPLALVTIGRAMAGIADPKAWRNTLTILQNKPHTLSGMMEESFRILEFSYNSLNDSTLKLCFLYCCLFPEDYHIRPHNLIGLWIGEGLLGDTADVYKMRDEGEQVLEMLKRACLLESGHDSNGEYVKMHDIIRDMGIWIAHHHGQRENKLRVIEKGVDVSAEMISKWEEAEKVSLWGKSIQNIDRTPPKCSQMETLFIRETNVRLVPRGFFNSMTAHLTVLDLSDNRNIQSFPEGICDLINLQYLNLSATSIRELPIEIKNLTCLRWLLLEDMLKGILLPIEAITSLPLNVFSQWSFNRHVLRSSQMKEDEMVKELGCMQHLTELSIIVFKSSSALNLFQSSNLRRCLRRVWITDRQNDLTSIIISYFIADSFHFSHLEVLYLHDCPMLVKMEISEGVGQVPNCPCFPSLVEVWVYNCELLDLSWLVHAPKLRELTVEMCDSMEKIIGSGFAPEGVAASGLFSHLEYLTLLKLPKLTSICDHALLFPQGASFHIEGCLGLRKLPLDSNSAWASFSINADVDWWPKFEWDPVTLVTFQLDNESSVEDMTFGEAVHQITALDIDRATMEFRP